MDENGTIISYDIEAQCHSVFRNIKYILEDSAKNYKEIEVLPNGIDDPFFQKPGVNICYDLVFVGKSLPPNEGGQTPIEAALLEKPLMFGPAMCNFRPATETLLGCGAALCVADEVELVDRGLELLRDEKRRAAMSTATSVWHKANQGAMERTLRELDRYLPARRA